MKKSDRISALVAGAEAGGALDRHYTGYFDAFNAQRYYEAHDILEHLWLRTTGHERLFFQGLIQFAGAFVHLQKQFQHPAHPKHATRLRPAVRLFHFAAEKLEPYAPEYLRLNVTRVRQLCADLEAEIVTSGLERNPWHPKRAPQLHLEPTPADGSRKDAKAQ
jgi:predicted metal-dependent hydrolase